MISVQQVQVCMKHHQLDFKQAKPALIITDVYAVFLNVKMVIIRLHVQLSIPHIPSAGEGFRGHSGHFTSKLDVDCTCTFYMQLLTQDT